MKKCDQIKTYYSLFNLVREDPYVKGKVISLALGRSGLGVTYSSALRQLANMYNEKVSFLPRLVLHNYTGIETTAYFCKKSGKNGCASIYRKLKKKKLSSEISSVFYLAGNNDFFVTTRKSFIDLNTVGLNVSEKNKFYNPIYTIPKGWNHSLKKCVRNFFKGEFEKKKLQRKIRGKLVWDDIDWAIYRAIRENLRKPLKHVSNEVGVTSYVVKKRLFQNVIPSCTIANFFFPLGYDHYDKIFLELDSEYENSIVKSLKSLPCTSYVYPLEGKTICILFHNGIKYILKLTRKMEEKGLAENILLSVPLASIF